METRFRSERNVMAALGSTDALMVATGQATCQAIGTMAKTDGDRSELSPLRFLSGGLEFALLCTSAALGGQWLDSEFGSGPWLTIGLLVLAFASGTWLLLRSLTSGSAGRSK